MSQGSHKSPPVTLLVEDDALDAQIACRALKAHMPNLTVVHAKDGAQALDLLLGRSGVAQLHPDLVLLDLKMPGLNGLDVLGQLRHAAETRTLPVVVFSSSDLPKDVVSAYELGANSFIMKPHDYAGYRTTMSTVGDYWLQYCARPRDAALVLNEPS